jgi:deoxyribonuclease V
MRSPSRLIPPRRPDGHWDTVGAKALQEEMRALVVTEDRIGRVRHLAGADVSYGRNESVLYAAVVLLDATTLETVETATFIGEAGFPYIPGLLSFRESPPVLEAFARLRRQPDLVLVDGHGRAHPRRFGLACHLGVLLGLPAIGVAKSLLVGEAGTVGMRRGQTAPLVHRGERIGTVLRTRDRVTPVYVSIGHLVSLRGAVRWALASTAGYRLPEPTRRAHIAVNELRRRA